MKLSRSTVYALEAVLQMARSRTGAPISSGDLAAASGMPVRYLLTILGKLTRKGILASRRGIDGGYVLARPPGEITLLELVEAVDGPLTQLCSGPGPDNASRPVSMRSRMERFRFSEDRSTVPSVSRDHSTDGCDALTEPGQVRKKAWLTLPTGTRGASSVLTRMVRDWLASIHVADLMGEFRVVDPRQPALRRHNGLGHLDRYLRGRPFVDSAIGIGQRPLAYAAIH
jgi:Rrf2 family protein